MDVIKTLWSRLSWRLLLYWGVLVGGLWAFAELADQIYDKQGFFFDEPILAWFYTLVSPTLTQIALVLSTVGGLQVMIALSVLLIIFLWFKSHREAVFFAVSMIGASVIMGLTKVILARPRPELFPDVNYWKTASPSFPSGHATGSTVFALTLFFVVRRLAPKWQGLVSVLGVLFCLSVSASRLYLQVHYPSDILAGLALGSGWVLGVNTLYNYRVRDTSTRSELLKLPEAVIFAYREEAKAKGLTEDEVVGKILTEHYRVLKTPHK